MIHDRTSHSAWAYGNDAPRTPEKYNGVKDQGYLQNSSGRKNGTSSKLQNNYVQLR